MKKEIKILMFMFVFLFSLNYVLAVDTPANETNLNITNETSELKLIKIYPNEVKLGDVTLNLLIENTGNVKISDINAYVSGKGFSTYEIIPIENLLPTQKSYIIVSGNVKQEGNIMLSIKINNKQFYYNLTVINSNIDQTQDELNRKEILRNISIEIDKLKQEYIELEELINLKQENDYDVSRINLDDLKSFIRSTQAAILSENIQDAQINFNLGLEEYQLQKANIDNAKKIQITDRVRTNALLISTILAACVAFFTLYEILKKKNEALRQKLMQFKGASNLPKKDINKK